MARELQEQSIAARVRARLPEQDAEDASELDEAVAAWFTAHAADNGATPLPLYFCPSRRWLTVFDVNVSGSTGLRAQIDWYQERAKATNGKVGAAV